MRPHTVHGSHQQNSIVAQGLPRRGQQTAHGTLAGTTGTCEHHTTSVYLRQSAMDKQTALALGLTDRDACHTGHLMRPLGGSRNWPKHASQVHL